MARRQRLFEMTPDELIEGVRMSAVAPSDEEILRRVKEMGAAEEQWSVPVPDAPIAGLYFSSELRIAAAPEAFLLLTF